MRNYGTRPDTVRNAVLCHYYCTALLHRGLHFSAFHFDRKRVFFILFFEVHSSFQRRDPAPQRSLFVLACNVPVTFVEVRVKCLVAIISLSPGFTVALAGVKYIDYTLGSQCIPGIYPRWFLIMHEGSYQ